MLIVRFPGLPPDYPYSRLRAALQTLLGVDVAVVITDTMGRCWRVGQTDAAIGAAGLTVLHRYGGAVDVEGNDLHVTEVALADELAAAADLVKGKLGGVPVAVVRGAALVPTILKTAVSIANKCAPRRRVKVNGAPVFVAFLITAVRGPELARVLRMTHIWERLSSPYINGLHWRLRADGAGKRPREAIARREAGSTGKAMRRRSAAAEPGGEATTEMDPWELTALTPGESNN